ncbi:MAG: UPF0149 family protein [Rhodocyclaceae bacterium]
MTPVLPHEALSDDEVAELDSLLAQHPESHSVEELDGLICALLVGPDAVPPAEWLPAVLGDGAVFASRAEEQRCTDLLMRHWNHVAQGFREDWSGVTAEEGANAMYFPLLDTPAESGHPLAEGWARGFRAGLGWLQEQHWDALEEDEECVTLINIIGVFDSGEKSPGIKLTSAERDELISAVAAGLQYLYAFWRRWLRVMSTPRTPHRADHQPGRNDSCPCGSGKKFKKCCGAPAVVARSLN